MICFNIVKHVCMSHPPQRRRCSSARGLALHMMFAVCIRSVEAGPGKLPYLVLALPTITYNISL